MKDEETTPTEIGSSSVGSQKNNAEITLGDIKYTIYRLKAGKFYAALKIYMDMIREIAPSTKVDDKGEAPVDFEKLVVGMFQTWPENMIKFIAVCCEKATTGDKGEGATAELTIEKIREDSYPEQITEAFKTCMALNRVGENLKNFVAPIGELGVQLNPAKT